MKVCVTGGAGFIGSHLVDRLVAEGHAVTVLDNLTTGNLENLARSRERIEILEGDIRDRDAVARAVRGAEVVFHQAALASVPRSVEQPVETTDVNVAGTLTVLVAAKEAGVRRVVFASSSSVYGDVAELPKRETMFLSPQSPYGASKAAGEAYLTAFQAAYGLEGIALRYFNVYGERQRHDTRFSAVVPRFLAAMAAGRSPTIHGDGLQTRDFTYVADVVDALLRALEAPSSSTGRPINIGGGVAVNVLTLAGMISEALGFHGAPVHLPPRKGEARHSLADVARARELLGWRPRTPLADGIRRAGAALVRTPTPTRAATP